ncbi:MAG: hypothetical protein RIS64_2070 [Bacteroidota bacterium]|jgi:hypothetical protein
MNLTRIERIFTNHGYIREDSFHSCQIHHLLIMEGLLKLFGLNYLWFEQDFY